QRMRTGYQTRNITVRQVLPNGNKLPQSQWGPVVSSQYPLGYYAEDYEFVSSIGDLDEYNGRSTVTPEYPQGTYAYFTTIDTNRDPVYPYVVGPQYYGVPISNRGVRIPSGVTTYAEQVQHTGAGCNDLFLDAASLPTVPNSSFALTLADGQGNATALFILGIGLLPTPIALFGCPIYLNLGAPFLTVGIVTLNGSGSYSLGAPIPNNPALVGVSADMQSAASQGSGTTTSNALTLLLK
ncbi:MAG: YHYH protein, partial [Planctomycetota bacterium]|nr:YHYH protein [Planctomycetota bacterium]